MGRLAVVIWTFVLLILISRYFTEGSDDKLLSVVTLYRHGARTPIKLYKKDPYGEDLQKLWPEGLGQLNDEGIQQQFLLGKWLRQRYGHLIRQKYHVEDILVVSSDSDRCLMSAASNLAGLYAPLRTQLDQILETWRPVPIHTQPASRDAALAGARACPKFARLYDELMKGDTYEDLFSANSRMLEYVSKHSGETIEDLLSLVLINDALNVETFYNLTLPSWTKDVYPKKMGDFAAHFFTSLTYTKELTRLRAGPVIDMVAKHFEAISGNIPGTAKFLMLSAHDTTLAHVMNSLSIYDMIPPKYAATIIFELRQGNAQKYVNIFYKNDTYSGDTHAKTLFGCDANCDLEEFRRIVAPIRIDEEKWAEECSDTH